MAEEMASLLKEAGRAGRAVKELEERLRKLQKLEQDLERNAFVVEPEVAPLDKALGVLAELGPLLALARAFRDDLLSRAGSVQERVKARVAAELSRELADSGLAIEGHLPELRAGLLTLEFQFDKANVRIWYGPRIAELGRSPLSAEAVAQAVREALSGLDQPPLETPGFLKTVHDAWRMVCLRAGRDPESGWSAPLVDVLAEVAWLRQDQRFREDPSRAHYGGYGRVQFSYDLYRVRERALQGKEMRLNVATREQTRKAADSLWVPRTAKGEGTHFATLTFRRMEQA